jgi:chromosome partitioning protein
VDGGTLGLKADRARATLYDLLAAMLEDEFAPAQFDEFVARKASNIGGGLPKLAVMPCSVRIEEFSTNMAKARRGYRSNDEFLAVFRRRKDQLRKWLRDSFDVVLVDCPPSLALQVKVFLSAADGYVVPCVPDRLSVRGSLYLVDRVAKLGYKAIRPVGTLWSLYREQNHVHRQVVDRARKREEPFDRLPRPFETIVPNATAIADATDPGKTPAKFRAKYSAQFAKLYEQLAEEVMARAAWAEEAPKSAGQPATV